MVVVGELTNGGKWWLELMKKAKRNWKGKLHLYMDHTGLITRLRDRRCLHSTQWSYTVTHSLLYFHQSSFKDCNHTYESPTGWTNAATKENHSRLLYFGSNTWSALMCLCVCCNILSCAIRPIQSQLSSDWPIDKMIDFGVYRSCYCCRLLLWSPCFKHYATNARNPSKKSLI